jgi:AbrB family looped-hinge helix DNA binding protein
MKATIDRAGRVVIPRDIRRLAGLKAGASLDVGWNDGTIELRPTVLPVRLERRGRALVAIPITDAEPITDELVEEIRQSAHLDHGGIN